jgi:hypothetical protein
VARLFLTQELAEQFAAALLSVLRVDHEIELSEARAVQDVISELVENPTVDFADVMLLSVSPASFASAVGAARSGPYRGLSVSSPREIAAAFRVAAERIAAADSPIGRSEAQAIDRFVEALEAVRAG